MQDAECERGADRHPDPGHVQRHQHEPAHAGRQARAAVRAPHRDRGVEQEPRPQHERDDADDIRHHHQQGQRQECERIHVQREQQVFAVAPSRSEIQDLEVQREQRHHQEHGIRHVATEGRPHHLVPLRRRHPREPVRLLAPVRVDAADALAQVHRPLGDFTRRVFAHQAALPVRLAVRGNRRMVLPGRCRDLVVAAEFRDREENQAERQVQAQRLDVAHAAAIDVFQSQLPRPEQKQQQRLPKLAFQRDVMADELVQELARAGRMQDRFLATFVAKITGHGGPAVRAIAGGVVRMVCHMNQHVKQFIAKKHLPIARPPSIRRIRI